MEQRNRIQSRWVSTFAKAPSSTIARLSHPASLVVAIDPPSPKEKLDTAEKTGFGRLKNKKLRRRVAA
ncbi:unnamed protein product [Linum trigynum]|uniref:Uncharacterized protein n=1 Tax=Linum trigynum TaxID=586398 RepID=A0AAV2CRZ7_9ROSI